MGFKANFTNVLPAGCKSFFTSVYTIQSDTSILLLSVICSLYLSKVKKKFCIKSTCIFLSKDVVPIRGLMERAFGNSKA